MFEGTVERVDCIGWSTLFTSLGEGRAEGLGFVALEVWDEGIGTGKVGLRERACKGSKARIAGRLQQKGEYNQEGKE